MVWAVLGFWNIPWNLDGLGGLSAGPAENLANSLRTMGRRVQVLVELKCI